MFSMEEFCWKVRQLSDCLVDSKVSEKVLVEMLKLEGVVAAQNRSGPIGAPDPLSPALQQKNVVYTIFNSVNKRVYVGQTSCRFVDRYHEGKWWEKTGNPELKADAIKYGYANFLVSIIPCTSDSHRQEVEAQMIRMNWSRRYNILPEALPTDVKAD